jgi:hypothetical protein
VAAHVLDPPAIATSYAPKATPLATVVTAVIAPAHIRSIAKPGTVLGSPARIAAVRPIVRPWSPICVVAAMATSSTRSGGSCGVAPHQLADDLHDHVVRAGVGVHPLRSGLAERGADAVDEGDVTDGTRHGLSSSTSWTAQCMPVTHE